MNKTIFLILFLLSSICHSQDMNKILMADEYYVRNENEKAKDIYEQLAKSPKNHAYILSNYSNLLAKLNETKTQEKFLKNIIKSAPTKFNYQAKLLAFYHMQENQKMFEKYASEIMKKNENSPYNLSVIGKNLYEETLYKTSEEFYLKARKIEGDESNYSLDLAKVYMAMNLREKMINEYLNYGSISTGQVDYVKKLLQMFLEKEDYDLLEEILIKKLQKDPENLSYAELMIWVDLQKKDFYSAFVQAKAIDKRKKQEGNRSLDVAQIAFKNKDYNSAQEIFEYIAKTYPDSYNAETAKKFALQSYEYEIKSKKPVSKESIRNLANRYERLSNSVRDKTTQFEAIRRKALLHAFYLNEFDSAIVLLKKIVSSPVANNTIKSTSKLDLGDVYLFNNEPWEATLLYSQVEKSNENNTLGYDAKLKNAQLHYFLGNFTLAKSHLDILKRNTTREISNNAIAKGVIIIDNTGLDSTDLALEKFAKIELLIFQNQKEIATEKLKKLLVEFPEHNLADEIHWELFQIAYENNQLDLAISELNKITSEFANGILADDAAFKKAEIFENNKKDEKKAMQLYQEFLLKYKGSVFAVEARKRFRKLRGDYLE